MELTNQEVMAVVGGLTLKVEAQAKYIAQLEQKIRELEQEKKDGTG